MNVPPKEAKALTETLNFKGTTIAALNKLSKSEAYDRIVGLARHNINALRLQFQDLAQKPINLRMTRIGSDFFNAATHPNFRFVWQDPDVRNFLERELGTLGGFLREHKIRVSMHPGQYTLLNSTNVDVVVRAIEDLEYHTDIMKYLGFGKSFHDHGTAINIHGGSKAGGLDAVVKEINNTLSPECRNLLTLENDEFSYGIDDLLTIRDHVAIVLDIHHHFIHTSGEYIQPHDTRIEQVKESWRGIRPLMHYSVSCDAVIGNLKNYDTVPDFAHLAEQGKHTKTSLRKHSQSLWNKAANTWAASHLSWADIECEVKNKNIGAKELYDSICKENA